MGAAVRGGTAMIAILALATFIAGAIYKARLYR